MKTPLFFQRRFLPMWTALSLGAFTDNALRNALIIGMTFGSVGHGGAGKDAIPIVGSLFAVAMLLFSSIAGQIAEKYETATIFRRTKFLEVAVTLVAALGFALDAPGVLIFALFAIGAQAALFSPARIAAMPKYLHADELVRGNGFCNAGLYVSILLGLLVGGVLIALPHGRLLVAACLFSSSLIGFLATLRAPSAAPGAPELKLDFNPFVQSARLFAFAFEARGVVRPLLGGAVFYYASTLVTVLTPLYARESLHADESLATVITALFAVGAGIGALSAAALARGRSGLGFSALGMALAGVMSIVIFFATPATPGESARSAAFLVNDPRGVVLLVAFIIAAAAMGLFVVPLQAAAQRRAPLVTRARIMAAGNMANAAAAMLGSLSVLAVTRSDVAPTAAFPAVAALQAAVVIYMVHRRATVRDGLYDESLAAAAAERWKHHP